MTDDANVIKKVPIINFPPVVIKILCFLFNLLETNKQIEEVKIERLIKKRTWLSIVNPKTQINNVIIEFMYRSLVSLMKELINEKLKINKKTKAITMKSIVVSVG